MAAILQYVRIIFVAELYLFYAYVNGRGLVCRCEGC